MRTLKRMTIKLWRDQVEFVVELALGHPRATKHSREPLFSSSMRVPFLVAYLPHAVTKHQVLCKKNFDSQMCRYIGNDGQKIANHFSSVQDWYTLAVESCSWIAAALRNNSLNMMMQLGVISFFFCEWEIMLLFWTWETRGNEPQVSLF